MQLGMRMQDSLALALGPKWSTRSLIFPPVPPRAGRVVDERAHAARLTGDEVDTMLMLNQNDLLPVNSTP